MSGGLYFTAMVLGDRDYRGVAGMNLIAHLPLLVIESAVTASAVSFLARVKPELIGLKGARP
jgi:cobalt/nickel transport system permease protein